MFAFLLVCAVLVLFPITYESAFIALPAIRFGYGFRRRSSTLSPVLTHGEGLAFRFDGTTEATERGCSFMYPTHALTVRAFATSDAPRSVVF